MNDASSGVMTERKRITCPETGSLEQVDLERTPLGLIVTGCTRYCDGDLACARECARRMDRRDRKEVDGRERVLLVLANLRDDAAQVATLLAEELAADGLAVELAALGTRSVPPLADYDAVVIGVHARLGHDDRAVMGYIDDRLADLATLPAFFYSVGGRGFHFESYAGRMARRTGWQPTASWKFADRSEAPRADVRAFARLIGDEIPAALQPSLA